MVRWWHHSGGSVHMYSESRSQLASWWIALVVACVSKTGRSSANITELWCTLLSMQLTFLAALVA